MKKTLYYKDFCKTEDHGYNLARAMQACRREGAGRLVLEPGLYEIRADRCEERTLCISNHGQNGLKRVALLIEDMQDFELDLGGATLCVFGEITPIVVRNSDRITIKNGTLQNPETMFMQARVVAHGENSVDLSPEFGAEQFTVMRRELVIRHAYSAMLTHVSTNIEFNGESGEMEPGTSDHTMGLWSHMNVDRLENGNYRVFGVTRKPPIGNVLIINASRRFGAGIFCENSRDILVQNFTVNSCFGMGFVAQMCENIHLDGFSTRREGGRLYTANADATHFVNCTGEVLVENGVFEGQLDDALNIHGMYTRITGRTGNELFVKEMHNEAKGIRIFRAGDRIRALDPESLIPYAEKTIAEVEYLNQDTVRLVLTEPCEDIAVGDDIENISRSASLVFRKNVVRNNRARGMLLASTAPMLIEDCYFHTGGCSIKFESDGAYWFESGGTTDVTIRGCHFDRCKHADKWGDAVIDMAPRRKVVENAYFHGTVRVVDNTFDMLIEKAVNFNNVESAIFEGNTVHPAEGLPTAVELCHVKEATVQDGIAII
ncbi:MAG: hypothetical protein IJ009_00730 [Clostridia bacterium]|nr:hypothetical protein [Clostridia bacterium]